MGLDVLIVKHVLTGVTFDLKQQHINSTSYLQEQLLSKKPTRFTKHNMFEMMMILSLLGSINVKYKQ